MSGGRARTARAAVAGMTQLPFMGTIYTMTLDQPELAGLLPHFAGYLTPLWHAADIDGLPADVRRLAR